MMEIKSTDVSGLVKRLASCTSIGTEVSVGVIGDDNKVIESKYDIRSVDGQVVLASMLDEWLRGLGISIKMMGGEKCQSEPIH